MPFIIACATPKGGVGKTTLAHGLAEASIRNGMERVVILDYDSQGSARHWWEMAQDAGYDLKYTVEVVPGSGPELTRWIRRHGDNYDIIIIDGHPQKDDHNRAAARNADVTVSPMSPQPAELVRAEDWLRYHESIGKPVFFVLNEVDERDAPRMAERAREFFQTLNIPRTKTEIRLQPNNIPESYGRQCTRYLTMRAGDILDEITP